MLKMKLALAATAALCITAAGKAHAWVQFCNATNVTIWTSYSWYAPSCAAEDGSLWEKAGWWSLTPGQCKIVYGPSISNRFSYYYAEGGGLVWAGPFGDCATNSAFDWCDNTCQTSGRSVSYRELDTGSSSNFTLTFTR
jgi:uncharacterized membrane protein